MSGAWLSKSIIRYLLLHKHIPETHVPLRLCSAVLQAHPQLPTHLPHRALQPALHLLHAG